MLWVTRLLICSLSMKRETDIFIFKTVLIKKHVIDVSGARLLENSKFHFFSFLKRCIWGSAISIWEEHLWKICCKNNIKKKILCEWKTSKRKFFRSVSNKVKLNKCLFFIECNKPNKRWDRDTKKIIACKGFYFYIMIEIEKIHQLKYL